MKRYIYASILDAIFDNDNAKEFLDTTSKRYAEYNKVEVGELINKLTNMRYNGTGGVRAYIMKPKSIASKFRSFENPIPNDFIVHQALKSFPAQFSQLKTTYNALKKNGMLMNSFQFILIQKKHILEKGCEC